MWFRSWLSQFWVFHKIGVTTFQLPFALKLYIDQVQMINFNLVKFSGDAKSSLQAQCKSKFRDNIWIHRHYSIDFCNVSFLCRTVAPRFRAEVRSFPTNNLGIALSYIITVFPLLPNNPDCSSSFKEKWPIIPSLLLQFQIHWSITIP